MPQHWLGKCFMKKEGRTEMHSVHYLGLKDAICLLKWNISTMFDCFQENATGDLQFIFYVGK